MEGETWSKCSGEDLGMYCTSNEFIIFAASYGCFRGGVRAPLLFTYKMITKTQVVELLTAEFGETPLFFVDIDVTGANDIRVLVDNDNGISISDCA